MKRMAFFRSSRSTRRGSESTESEGAARRCARCGARFDGQAEPILDPHGRWVVCARCGHYATEREDES